jgi:hypothetical protein
MQTPQANIKQGGRGDQAQEKPQQNRTQWADCPGCAARRIEANEDGAHQLTPLEYACGGNDRPNKKQQHRSPAPQEPEHWAEEESSDDDVAQGPGEYGPQILVAKFHLVLTVRENDADGLNKTGYRSENEPGYVDPMLVQPAVQS